MISLVDFNRRGQKQSKPGENKSNLRYEWTRLVLNKTSSLAEIKRPHRLLFEHLVTEAAKKSRKRTRPHTSITQPASCGCYHRDGAAPMSCKLCSRPSVSLQRTKETDKTFLYTTKHTRRQGLHFQSACSCSSREKTQGVCVCVCVRASICECVAFFGTDTLQQMLEGFARDRTSAGARDNEECVPKYDLNMVFSLQFLWFLKRWQFS